MRHAPAIRLPATKIYERYVGAHVVVATLLSLLVLLSLFLFGALVDDLGKVGRGDYTLLRSLQYVALTAPRLAFSLFPVAAVVGSLLGLGLLAANSELIVLRTAGVSVAEIVRAVLKAGALLMVAALLLGELVAPLAERVAERRRADALAGGGAEARGGPGFWMRDGDSFIHVRRALGPERPADVSVYEFDAARRLRVASHAREARFVDGRWRLSEVSQTRFDGEETSARVLRHARWGAGFTPELVELAASRPEALPALGLFRTIRHLRRSGVRTEPLELALWTRLAYPLATGVMVFLAVPMVLGRPRGIGLGARMVVGVFLGVAFHVVDQTTGQVSLIYGLSPPLAALAPTALFLGAGLWMLRRVP